jgi:hypothetical protein
MAYEEPGYEVIRTTPEYEIRRYESFIVAEVDVSGDFDDSGSQAFRILAGYIFGKNIPAGAESDEANAPDEGVKMAMTIPVISKKSAAAGSSYTYSFVMPAEFSLESLPKPVDGRVRIREIPGQIVAAHRYSGRWTEKNYQEHLSAMRESLQRDGVEPDGQTQFARYHAPWTPWFMRRNEIMVAVTIDES